MKYSLIIIIVFLFFGCVEKEPDGPFFMHLEDVDVAGGFMHDLGKEVSLFASFNELPRYNPWEFVWYVNGLEIDSVPLDNSSSDRVVFTGYTPTVSGEYLYEGCIVWNEKRICKNTLFYIR